MNASGGLVYQPKVHTLQLLKETLPEEAEKIHGETAAVFFLNDTLQYKRSYRVSISLVEGSESPLF